MSIFEQNLIREDGTIKGLPNKFYYDLIRLDDYYYDKKENRICLQTDTGIALNNIKEQVECTSLEFLYSIIELHQDLEAIFEDFKTNFLFFNVAFESKIINSYAKRIIRWCKKYGYPYVDSIKQPNNSKFNTRIIRNNKINYATFSVIDFLVSVNDIFSLYLLYLCIVGSINKIPNKTYISNVNALPISVTDLNDISDFEKEECESVFEQKLNQYELSSVISISDKHYPFISIKANNLFESAAYQISLMMYNPKYEIKICPLCNKPFEPKNRKQKYCNNSTCYPQLAYKRKIAAEKRKQKNKPENK